MWLQFLLENIHFAINILAALVTFAVFWLYTDAWLGKKNFKDLTLILGFFLLSISFLIHAVFIESSLLTSSIFGANINSIATSATRIIALTLILISQVTTSLQKKPAKLKANTTPALLGIGATFALTPPHLQILFPLLTTIVSFFYLRRATVGLEDHLKPVTLSFFLLSISELLALSSLFANTNNIQIYKLVAPFGPLWIASHLVLTLTTIVLGKWVFGYLLKRFQTQLFMFFTTGIVLIFLIITVAFTGLLLKNLQDETTKRLETDAKVLNFALNSKKSELLSDIQVFAQNPQITQGTAEKDQIKLASSTQDFLLAKKLTSLVVVSETGQVLMRGEDKERFGDSLSDNPLVKRGLLEQSLTSVVTKDGPIAPLVTVEAVTPIKNEESQIIGAVLGTSIIDNAFVDGIKSATGLEISTYGENQLSATTLVATDKKSRAIGIKEENKKITQNLLVSGENYNGPVEILNTPYFAAYVPLKDVDNTPVGMISVAKEQIGVLKTAGRSIELTFFITVILMVLSVIPSNFIARYLTNQLK